MSKRDELAEKYVGEMLVLEGVSTVTRRDFKAGWDAAILEDLLCDARIFMDRLFKKKTNTEKEI